MNFNLEHDWDELYSILSFKRAAFSVGEKLMIKKHIVPACDAKDDYGNYYAIIGDNPDIMWSSHTDTVHGEKSSNTIPRQNLYQDKNTGELYGSGHDCLGADCGAGVAIMLQMMKKQVPGLYVFHRAEESGGRGSYYIANKNPDLVKNIKCCIAFDRFGTQDIITDQMYRTASDEFAQSLSDILNEHDEDFKFAPSDEGVFTDSANYTDLIGECTNVAVGYWGHHTNKEELDLVHLDKLLSAILKADFSKLQYVREPGEVDFYYGYGAYMNGYTPKGKKIYDLTKGEDYNDGVGALGTKDMFKPHSRPTTDPDIVDMEELIRRNPRVAAEIFQEFGYSFMDLVEDYDRHGVNVHQEMAMVS